MIKNNDNKYIHIRSIIEIVNIRFFSLQCNITFYNIYCALHSITRWNLNKFCHGSNFAAANWVSHSLLKVMLPTINNIFPDSTNSVLYKNIKYVFYGKHWDYGNYWNVNIMRDVNNVIFPFCYLFIIL